MKRGELKALIKECVIEVLQDGIGNAPIRLQETASPGRRRPARQERRSHPTDHITYGGDRERAPRLEVNTNISQDPILDSIFQDTAATTLQEQVSSERHGRPMVAGGADAAARFAAEHEPDELFEGAANWAALAFK